VIVERDEGGHIALQIDGKPVWSGNASAEVGALGLLAQPWSSLVVDHYEVTGHAVGSRLSFLYTEGWLGAGEDPAHWMEQQDARFRFGAGAVSRRPDARVKWNFIGQECTLWSPRGPEYGAAEVLLDGVPAGVLDLHSNEPQDSRPAWQRQDLEQGFHALIVQARSGAMPVDSLDVEDPVHREKLVVDER
jgi:hypothetical protein